MDRDEEIAFPNLAFVTLGFDLGYAQMGDELILRQEFDNDHLMLQPDQFADWNKVLENLFPLYKESATLSKK